MEIREILEEFKVYISIPLPEPLTILGFELRSIDINETIIMSWVSMLIIITAAWVLTRKLKQIPKGAQAILEAAIEFLDSFSKQYFGHRAKTYGPYIGTVFLFLLVVNIIPVLSPLAVSVLALEPPFSIRPPARDINFTAAIALITILLVLIGGLKARGLKGWAKNLASPVPMMLPFNLLDYIIRPLSLCLRLFGNILGGFIIMELITLALPVPLLIPILPSLYFDFFDGLIQAVIFTFLTTIFIGEAVEVE
ncbi:ATP synthase subunit a [Spirochaetia bacterium]|nr:ATP synthase subunit a [Spirochaetia bacterium]